MQPQLPFSHKESVAAISQSVSVLLNLEKLKRL